MFPERYDKKCIINRDCIQIGNNKWSVGVAIGVVCVHSFPNISQIDNNELIRLNF